MTNLELQRRRQRMTLRQVATAAGCSFQLISRIERKSQKLTESTGRKLAKAVGLKSAEWKTLQKTC